MAWIINFLLDVILFIWTLWVCGFGRADINAPFLKWLSKCEEKKKKSGGIAWKEFLAIMKYLTLHYIQKHTEAEELFRYGEYVDISDYYRFVQLGEREIPDEDIILVDKPSNHQSFEINKDQKDLVVENDRVWWQEEYKPYTSFEHHEKQINENALEESIISMIISHRQRYQEEGDKTVKSILKPKLYTKANIQLFSDTNQQSVLKVLIDKGDAELFERMRSSQYFKLFEIDKEDSDTISFILDFHNDEELAQKAIKDILITIYNQPKECAISYINNVSGYTKQEQGRVDESSGCGFWTWFWVLLIVAILIWIFI